MIGLLLKHWKLILDILIIVAIVVLVFLWNPFNLFGKGLKLQDTANMVSEIKEIGELVTAEYYGEVIASDEEAELGLVERDTIEILGESMYSDIKNVLMMEYENGLELVEEEIKDIRRERRKNNKKERKIKNLKGNILKELKTSLPSRLSFQNEDVFNSLILYLGKHEFNVDPNSKKFVRKLEHLPQFSEQTSFYLYLAF
ncbi:MAG: hypothetical protein AAF391_09220, partial [Bacteroidota bacterium]